MYEIFYINLFFLTLQKYIVILRYNVIYIDMCLVQMENQH